MEQNQHQQSHQQVGLIDLLEIYHARQMRDQIIHQLRRLRASSDQQPLFEAQHKRDIRGYYEALLLTVADLQQQLGDNEL